MLKKPVFVWFILIVILGISSCSNYQKLYKSDDVDAKYEMALKYYNQENYYRALELLEAVIPFYREQKRQRIFIIIMLIAIITREITFWLAITLNGLQKLFPKVNIQMNACLWQPIVSTLIHLFILFDQTSTVEALVELQLYMDVFPDSERIEEANELMENLRNKLEKKAFEIAKLYLQMEDYKAAITSFNNLLESFPDSRYQEPVLFNIAKAQYFYALHSIESKKKERFIEMVDVYDAYIALYPDSENAKQVTIYYNNSREYLSSN